MKRASKEGILFMNDINSQKPTIDNFQGAQDLAIGLSAARRQDPSIAHAGVYFYQTETDQRIGVKVWLKENAYNELTEGTRKFPFEMNGYRIFYDHYKITYP